jgi:hypothetical protein
MSKRRIRLFSIRKTWPPISSNNKLPARRVVPDEERLVGLLGIVAIEEVDDLGRNLLQYASHKPSLVRMPSSTRASRIDDLKVYFSLNLFSRRKAYRVLPVELQRDVKAFFGSYKSADSAGREMLFSVGNPSTIAKALRTSVKKWLGLPRR